jgi:hypothetical protein
MALVLSRESRPDGAIVPARKQTFPDSHCVLFHLIRQRKTALTATTYRLPNADSDMAQSRMLFPISGAGKKPAKEVARKPARSAGRRKAAG